MARTPTTGYITAASTWTGNPYGFLITRSKIVSDAPEGTFHLGRPWHPGGEPAAVAQVLIRDTELPAAVKAAPWTDMGGFSWRMRGSPSTATAARAAVTGLGRS
ncbi:hypothetical protein SALBM311S_00219 [Streptomyces alboniger]